MLRRTAASRRSFTDMESGYQETLPNAEDTNREAQIMRRSKLSFQAVVSVAVLSADLLPALQSSGIERTNSSPCP
jgi:hypothetical protein